MYYSEEGIFFLSVTYTADYAAVTAKCFRRMKKTDSWHNISADIELTEKSLSGKCSCVVGNRWILPSHHCFVFLPGTL